MEYLMNTIFSVVMLSGVVPLPDLSKQVPKQDKSAVKDTLTLKQEFAEVSKRLDHFEKVTVKNIIADTEELIERFKKMEQKPQIVEAIQNLEQSLKVLQGMGSPMKK
jgi:hypothetical protein